MANYATYTLPLPSTRDAEEKRARGDEPHVARRMVAAGLRWPRRYFTAALPQFAFDGPTIRSSTFRLVCVLPQGAAALRRVAARAHVLLLPRSGITDVRARRACAASAAAAPRYSMRNRMLPRIGTDPLAPASSGSASDSDPHAAPRYTRRRAYAIWEWDARPAVRRFVHGPRSVLLDLTNPRWHAAPTSLPLTAARVQLVMDNGPFGLHAAAAAALWIELPDTGELSPSHHCVAARGLRELEFATTVPSVPYVSLRLPRLIRGAPRSLVDAGRLLRLLHSTSRGLTARKYWGLFATLVLRGAAVVCMRSAERAHPFYRAAPHIIVWNTRVASSGSTLAALTCSRGS